MCVVLSVVFFLYCFSVFFFKQKTAYEMRISDWSPDVCSSDLVSIQAGPFLFKWVRADSEAVGRPDIDRRLRGFPQLAASSTASPALCTSSPAPSTVLQALMTKAPESSRAAHIFLVMIVSLSSTPQLGRATWWERRLTSV